MEKIEFVVTWLDSLDPIWQELLAIHKPGSKGDASKARFRDMDIFRYWFRAICLTSSILLFAWHLDAFNDGQHLLHIALFYPANIGFLFGVLYGCKLMNSIKSNMTTHLSIGTLVVVGLHIVLVTIANFVFGHLCHINGTICYQWNEAIPLAILITALLYPVILLGKHHFPALLGRFSHQKI